MRNWIAGSLKLGGLLLAAVLVAAVLSAILWSVEDEQAARAACVVAAVFLVCWVLDFVTLVVLLAAAYLAENRPDR